MTNVENCPDESETPATIKMPAPLDLLQRQKAYSEGLTASLRANGVLQGDDEARVTFDETGRITAIELDSLSAQQAENFVRKLTALKVHDPEKPELIESATFAGLSPVEYLDRERKQRDKPSKSKTPSGPSTRVK